MTLPIHMHSCTRRLAPRTPTPTHPCTRTWPCTCTRTRTHAQTHREMDRQTDRRTSMPTYISFLVCAFWNTYIHTHTHIYIYIYFCISMYMYVHRHTRCFILRFEAMRRFMFCRCIGAGALAALVRLHSMGCSAAGMHLSDLKQSVGKNSSEAFS